MLYNNHNEGDLMDFRNNFSILIVDDEKSLLENLYNFLKNKGFKKIYTAKNLKESKFKLENNEIDLIVLDLMLSDGSGFDLLKEVRKSSDVSVIILSALDGIDDRREGFENKRPAGTCRKQHRRFHASALCRRRKRRTCAGPVHR